MTPHHFPESKYAALEAFLRECLRKCVQYVPGGRDPNKALDCAGLVIAAFEHLGARLEYDRDKKYGTYWYTASMVQEEYLVELRKSFHIMRAPLVHTPRPGDLLLFRMQSGTPVSHAGFLLANGNMVSIYNGRAVCESRADARFWVPRFYGYAAPKDEVWA